MSGSPREMREMAYSAKAEEGLLQKNASFSRSKSTNLHSESGTYKHEDAQSYYEYYKKKAIDRWSYYYVPKVVRIRAPPLQIPNLLFQSSCVIGLALWMCWSLHFMRPLEVVAASAFLELVAPQRNFAWCHDSDIDCDDVASYHESGTRPYCTHEAHQVFTKNFGQYFAKNDYNSDSGDPLHEYSKARWPITTPDMPLGCAKGDKHDMIKQTPQGQLITTAITTMKQQRCKKDCIWQNKNASAVYIENSEDFHVKLRHEVHTDGGKKFESDESTGFLMINGKQNLIECKKEKEKAGQCRTGFKWEHFQPCGTNCFTTGFADFIPLSILLKVANISLDEGLCGDLSRRWWGTSILLDIEYFNDNPMDFWFDKSWALPRLHLKHTYTVKKVADYVSLSEAQYNRRNAVFSSKRQLIRHSGIEVIVKVRGHLIDFHPVYFVRSLAVFLVVLKISQIVTKKLVLNVYKCLPGFAHLPAMYKFFRYTDTPGHHDLKKEGLDHLDEHEHDRANKFSERMKNAEEWSTWWCCGE